MFECEPPSLAQKDSLAGPRAQEVAEQPRQFLANQGYVGSQAETDISRGARYAERSIVGIGCRWGRTDDGRGGEQKFPTERRGRGPSNGPLGFVAWPRSDEDGRGSQNIYWSARVGIGVNVRQRRSVMRMVGTTEEVGVETGTGTDSNI